MKRYLPLVVGAWFVGISATGWAQTTVPAGYPSSYSEIVAAAEREGALSIYSTLDLSEVSDLLESFKALYPRIKIEYVDENSTVLYDRVVRETAAGHTADLIWSSAMDLQIKLVNDGYAMTYSSPEKDNLLEWAKWKDQAYGTTAEPIVFAYNTRLIRPDEVPRSHAAFAKLISQRQDLKGKVASYDHRHSGVGFLYATQDVQVSIPVTWDTVKAMGQAEAKFYTSTRRMLDRVKSGEHAIAYNAIGSYVIRRFRDDQSVGFVMPSDYTLVMSRIAFVSAKAKHPAAAKLFLDFVLSKNGQTELAKRAMASVRKDLEKTHGIASLPGAGDVTLHPIRVGPELLTYLDQLKRRRFLQLWQRAFDPS